MEEKIACSQLVLRNLETTYLKPYTHFLQHLNFVGGKNPFSLPLPTFNLGIYPGA